MSVCLSVRMNDMISETIKARKFGFGMQILVAGCHAHTNSNADLSSGHIYLFFVKV